MKNVCGIGVLVLLAATTAATAATSNPSFVVTSSNAAANELLVYDATGALVQAVSTQGQGGASGRAGGVASDSESIAVVNFGSQSVSVFARGGEGFVLDQVITTLSAPVSVAFGLDHLYVLGTTTIESHRLVRGGVDAAADGSASLVRGDGSAAHVGVVGDQLIATEKGGAIEVVRLVDGTVSGDASALALPDDALATPFGLATRGSSAYVTVAGSDEVVLIRDGKIISQAATGVPNGEGQQSPCWAALAGPFLFTANSPSHSISRLVVSGHSVTLDAPVAASTGGAPIDIAFDSGLLAVIESNGGSAHVTQFRVDDDGALVQTATTAIASAANGVVVVSAR